jgi:CBS domain-containing protein
MAILEKEFRKQISLPARHLDGSGGCRLRSRDHSGAAPWDFEPPRFDRINGTREVRLTRINRESQARNIKGLTVKRGGARVKAREVMVSPVITVGENETVREVAKLLIAKRISAVPVVDGAGKIVGIVTEADLLHRAEAGTSRPASWWLSLMSGDWALADDYVKSHAVKVKDVMTREVKTADPDTPLVEIADLLEEQHFKPVPIVSGDLVGIVSRANILQVISSARPKLEISPSDALIRKKLMDELKNQPWSHVDRLNATVTAGVADLWGIVDSEKERQAIRVAAETISGVSGVNDHLMRRSALVY